MESDAINAYSICFLSEFQRYGKIRDFKSLFREIFTSNSFWDGNNFRIAGYNRFGASFQQFRVHDDIHWKGFTCLGARWKGRCIWQEMYADLSTDRLEGSDRDWEGREGGREQNGRGLNSVWGALHALPSICPSLGQIPLRPILD